MSQDIVLVNIHYEADSDERGARVFTNLENTVCPGCNATVEPNAEHLCGNRALPTKPLRKRKVAILRRVRKIKTALGEPTGGAHG